MDDQFAGEMRNLLRKIEVNDALDTLESAMGWTVECKDLEFDHVTLFGFFTDPVEAMRYCIDFEEDVNRGVSEGEPGWKCTTVPIFKSSEMKKVSDA